MREDRRHWEEKYAAPDLISGMSPCAFLAEHLTLIPRGRALDIATGEGRNAIFLARNGFVVEGVDLSYAALLKAKVRANQEGVLLMLIQADLTQFHLLPNRYDLIVNVNYLQRSLVPQIKASLKPHGMVLFETFLIDQAAVGHPRDPAHFLRHNELLDLFRDLRVLRYREGKVIKEGNPAYLASLLAERST